MRIPIAIAFLVLTACMSDPSEASYSFFIGKHLTRSGVTYLGGWGDEPSSHWIEISPRAKHAPGTTLIVGADAQSRRPGSLIAIPQVEETARWFGAHYSEFAKLPGPLTNGGLNEHQVAVRDVWASCRDEFKQWIPEVQKGLQYSDLAKIVLQRAKSAREGAELIGRLIDEYGYTAYGSGNSHMIADPDEGWIVIQCPSKGIWAAERIGPDEVRVSRPGYIQEIPRNYQENPNFMGSENLLSFAIEQGWYDPDSANGFNFQVVYGGEPAGRDSVRWVEKELLKRAKGGQKISFTDVIWAARLPEFSGDASGYSQVVPLEKGTPPELGLVWYAAAGAVTAPFVPIFLGVQDVPPEYKKHRYLTRDESELFYTFDPEKQPSSRVPRGIESTKSAVYVFKRLMYLTQEHFEQYYPLVLKTITAFESRQFADTAAIMSIARLLLDDNHTDLATTLLTYFVRRQIEEAISVSETLGEFLETRTKLSYGVRDTLGPNPPALFNEGDRPRRQSHP